MRVLPAQVLERVQMPGGRETRFGTGDVESGHLPVAELDAQFGDLAGARGVPHGGQQQPDPDLVTGRGRGLRTRPRTPSSTACTTSSRVRLLFGVQFGREPHLGVHHAVGRQVLHALGSHPHQRLPGLHHRRWCG